MLATIRYCRQLRPRNRGAGLRSTSLPGTQSRMLALAPLLRLSLAPAASAQIRACRVAHLPGWLVRELPGAPLAGV